MVGGGSRAKSLLEKFVNLASKSESPRVMMLTMASFFPEETGLALVKEFPKLGVERVAKFHFSRENALKP